MNINLLTYLECPICGCDSISLDIEQEIKGDVTSGHIICENCKTHFPIINGIPSMLPHNNDIECRPTLELALSSSLDSIQTSEMKFRNDHAYGYDTLSVEQANLEIDFVLDELTLLPTHKHTILDLGCGTGRALLSLIPYSQTLIGVDFSFESLKVLQAKLNSLGPNNNIHLIHGDALHPPLKENQFDIITSIQLLQSFPSADIRLSVLKEIHRVAKPNAKFVLSVFYYSLLKQMRAKSIKDPSQDVYEHEGLHLGRLYYHNYTKQELRYLLTQAGFKTIHMKGVNTPLTRRFGHVGVQIEKVLKSTGVFTPFSHWITVSAIVEDNNNEL